MTTALAAASLAALGSVALSSTAAAATCTSGGPGRSAVTYTIDLAGATCRGGSSGNINGSDNDPFLDAFPDHALLDKSDDSGKGLPGFDLTLDLSDGGKRGAISFDLGEVSGYADLVLALKAGGGFVPFFLPAGVGSIYFSGDKALSHANLYGVESQEPGPAPVPLPAAAWLLLSGVAGLGVLSRRRRTA